MKKTSIIKYFIKTSIILLPLLGFSFSGLFSEDVNVIMNNGSYIKGSLLGKTADEIVIQEAGGKTDTIKLADIKGVFDPQTGNPVDLSVNENTSQVSPQRPGRVIIYRPKPVIIEGPRNAFGIDLLGASLGSIRLSYERALSDWFSLRIDAAYSPDYFWQSGVSLWSAAVYGRVYFGHYIPWFNTWYKGLGGMFFEAGAGYEGAAINYSYSDRKGSVSINGSFPPSPMARFVFGNKIIFGNESGFYLEPYAGFEVSFGSWNIDYSGTGRYSPQNSDIFPYVEGLGQGYLFGIDFGYTF